MHKNHDNVELCWISMILRLSIGLLFAVAGIYKFTMGIGTTANYIVGTFKDTFLPVWLVLPYAYALPFVEILIAVWLLLGRQLRAGWIFTSFVMVSLAFGMSVAKNPEAANNYMFIVICCLGLYVSQFDCCKNCCGLKKSTEK